MKREKVYGCAHSEYEVGYMDKTLWCNCRESGHRTCDCGRYSYTQQFCPFFRKGELKGEWEISEDELEEARKYKERHHIVDAVNDANGADENKTLPRWLFHNTEKLRKLIVDNPGLPLVVCAGEDAYDHDTCPRSTICSRVSVQIAEVLYSGDWCESAERIFIDRDDLEQHIRDSETFQDDHDGLSDEEFDKAVYEEMDKYDKDWAKAIVLEVDN